jgi:hypothetical protein
MALASVPGLLDTTIGVELAVWVLPLTTREPNEHASMVNDSMVSVNIVNLQEKAS